MTKSKKRKQSGAVETPNASQKRARTDSERPGSKFVDAQPHPDATTGLRSFFPGIEGHSDDSDLEGDPSDGMDYLRRVRHQAKGIPHLLSAPRSKEEIELSQHGYYSNGVYIAYPPSQGHPDADENDPYDAEYYEDEEDEEYDPEAAEVEESTTDLDLSHVPPTPQEAYRASLLSRFHLLRQQLSTSPPLKHLQRLTPDQLISLPRSRPALQAWLHQLKTADPVPAQLASMQQESVLSALELCARQIQPGGDSRPSARVGAWIFGLLARLGDAGTLDNDGVSVVREMGKRAVAAVMGVPAEVSGFTAGEDDQEENERSQGGKESSDGEGTQEGDEQAKLAAAKKRLLGNLTVATEVENDSSTTEATLDMIITLTGEVFGQRDLLEFRRDWN